MPKSECIDHTYVDNVRNHLVNFFRLAEISSDLDSIKKILMYVKNVIIVQRSKITSGPRFAVKCGK